MFDLTGKTVLITGASSGIGSQAARTLSTVGAKVILTARRFDKLKKLESELKNAKTLIMDVSNQESVESTFKILEKAGEKIDICINNAGIAGYTSLFDGNTSHSFESIVQTNLMGVWYVTKASANHMKRHGIEGSIINIGSINGNAIPSKMGAGYNASKAAVMHLTRSLVGELSPHNIRINAISPGFFPTDMTMGANSNHEWVNKIVQQIPLGFMPTLSDLDGAILYLASQKTSRYVTGSIITIDGGISWTGQ